MADVFTGMIQEDLRRLVPPVSELKRVGPIFDVDTYLRMGQLSLSHLKKLAYLKPHHKVLDVGCGFGRVAIQLTKVLNSEAQYLGLDVVKAEIDWCTENISARYPNFEFKHVDANNKMYNPAGQEAAANVGFPVAEGETFDLVFLFSVFTHMLPADVQHYLNEIYRHLRPGGTLLSSFFVVNADSSRYMQAGKSQFQFSRQEGGYYIHNPDLHEGAVAYDEDEVYRMLRASGFVKDKVVYGGWTGRHPADSGQDLVVSVKPADLAEPQVARLNPRQPLSGASQGSFGSTTRSLLNRVF